MKWFKSVVGIALGVGIVVAAGPVGVGVGAVAVGVIVAVAVGTLDVGVTVEIGVQVGPTGGITGAQSTSLCAELTIASPSPPAKTTWIRLMVSSEVVVPFPPGICSFKVTVAMPGTTIIVFGGGLRTIGVPLTASPTNMVFASLLVAVL